ncbi:MAG: hypothetical protein ACRDEA_15600, partial [Microcystaceae cyanobacterium]
MSAITLLLSFILAVQNSFSTTEELKIFPSDFTSLSLSTLPTEAQKSEFQTPILATQLSENPP